MTSFLRTTRFVAITLFVCGACYCLWQWNAVPSGVFEVTWRAGKESPFLYGWGPANILKADSGSLEVFGEKAIFKVKLPAADFKKIDFKISYEAPDAPVVALGAADGPGDSDYQERILYSRALQESGWSRREADGFSIFESSPGEKTLSQLIGSAAPVETLGTQVPLSLGAGVTREKIYSVSLRGSHIFWILPGESGAEIAFRVQDMNRHPGTDDITITAEKSGQILKRLSFEDEDSKESQSPGALKDIRLSLPGAAGPVRVEIDASDDMFIRELKTNAARMVFEKRLFLGDDIGYGGKSSLPVLWTDSESLAARTPHLENRQTIYFVGWPLVLGRSDEKYYLRPAVKPGGLVPIRLQKNDAELFVSGFISLAPEDFFVPVKPEIFWDSSLPERGAVIADYSPPEAEQGVYVSEAGFDAGELMREPDGSYKFYLLLPGAFANGAKAAIRSITLTARR